MNDLDLITLDNAPELDPEPHIRDRQPNARKTTSGVDVRNVAADRHALLLAAALAYAKRGLFIIPLHEPTFDNAGNLTGCTCEAYKRSQKYHVWLNERGQAKRFDPNFKCRTPGKHPRLSDWETLASNDPAQIRKWWRQWPTANIGLAVGKSGLVTFDRDTYKEVYGDDSDLFTQADKETATQISGGRGEHLVFKKPEGKTYTNANNTLPAGVDVRCDGGMQVVWPSIHPSGNPYEWEEGYSIFDVEPKPLPATLEAILDAAQDKHSATVAVTFTTPLTDRPELLRWRIGREPRELIHGATTTGDRSRDDSKVVTSLCRAGATDDEIKAVYQHYAIGQGKYADRGDDYLAMTIASARKVIAATPRPDVPATIANARLLIKTHNLVDYMPSGKKPRHWRKLGDAALDEMATHNTLVITIGKKRLGSLANCSDNTAQDNLDLLSGLLFKVTKTAKGNVVELLPEVSFSVDSPLLVVKYCDQRGQSTENDINEYTPHKRDDAFAVGTSRYIKDRMVALSLALDVTFQAAKRDYSLKSLGEGMLLLKDTHARVGDMTAQEYATETGLKLSTTRAILRFAEKMALAEWEREGSRGPKVYSFVPDFWDRVAELTPNLRTYRISDQRENKRLESAQQWAHRGVTLATTPEEKQTFERRYAKLGRQRLPHLERLHPTMSAQDRKRLAYEVARYKRDPETEQAIQTKRQAQRIEHRETVDLVADLIIDHIDIGVTKDQVISEVAKFGLDEYIKDGELHRGELVRAVMSSKSLLLHAINKQGNRVIEQNIAAMRAEGLERSAMIWQLKTAGFMQIEIDQALAGGGR